MAEELNSQSSESKGAQPNEVLTPEKVRELNSSVWKEQYVKQHDYLEAESMVRALRKKADEQGIKNPDIIAELWATEAWAQYRQDVNAKANNNRSWVSARQGLVLLLDLEANHEIRSRLLGVAGLCQKVLVKEQDEPAEPLLRAALIEAQKSRNPSRVGEATNQFGLLYFTLAREEKDVDRKKLYYQEAITIFEEAARIHEQAGTKTEVAGHPYNNLTECYSNLGRNKDAIASANKALEKYGDEKSPHSFSARHRKSLALRGLGKERKDKSYFDQALAIYEEHKRLRVQDAKLSEQKRARLIANENKNISSLQQEMQVLGLL